MKNLSIDALRSFVMVAETGSFTRAADRVSRTQPAISQQLKKLEGLLGQPLLLREGVGIELTAAGAELLSYARQILSLNDEALGHLSHTGVSGRVRFGIPSEFAVSLLPKIVSRFAKAYPNVTLEVISALSRNLVADSRDDNYDLILVLQDKPSPANVNYVKTDELVWVSSASSRAHLHDSIKSEVPLIVAPDGCIYRKRALHKLKQAKKSCRIVYTNPDLTGIQAAIEEGMGVTVLARSTVPESLSIIESPEALPKLGEIGISLRQLNKSAGSAVKVLADYVKLGLI